MAKKYPKSRLFGLKYTHIIRHKSKEGRVYDYLAANVTRTGTHIVYDSENAWGDLVSTSVPYGEVLGIEKIEDA